ncbi:uncharacterized protein LACBIDRAFT_322408 [Laccaria bicolor S238N-H82]|uniref:Predicted protein n=1 Tax=Laccaria bicolor (strain S238N-H82 / ATCC MYA-4686) TaxID=486041 RepID=B0CW65_LACBS|nr:uncharacterized protein LACBIDRAFT_322408 [Laccaria bicolor S238N-H82]EDR13013.1 predicted protein [Laccaria bicolor S238N-H82]|eukprot:XP_001875511.1 predicted protein [Laccaria bicolor S238N-H82]
MNVNIYSPQQHDTDIVLWQFTDGWGKPDPYPILCSGSSSGSEGWYASAASSTQQGLLLSSTNGPLSSDSSTNGARGSDTKLEPVELSNMSESDGSSNESESRELTQKWAYNLDGQRYQCLNLNGDMEGFLHLTPFDFCKVVTFARVRGPLVLRNATFVFLGLSLKRFRLKTGFYYKFLLLTQNTTSIDFYDSLSNMHASTIKGPVGMNFGQAEREGFQEVITPLFSRYLRKCYTKSECHAQALPSSNPVLSRLMGDNVSVHRADWDMDSAASRSEDPVMHFPPNNAAPLNSELGAPPPSTQVPLRPASPLSTHGSPPPSLRRSPPPSLRRSPPCSPDPICPSDMHKGESISGKKRKASLSSVVDSGAGGENGSSGGAKKRKGLTSAKGSRVGRGRRMWSTVNAGAQGSKSAPLTKTSISMLKSPTVPVSAQPPIGGSSGPFPSWFTSYFLAWWGSLLPATAGEDLSPIAKPGINGLLSMMAGLFFGGASCGPTSAWAECLEDVSVALASLVVPQCCCVLLFYIKFQSRRLQLVNNNKQVGMNKMMARHAKEEARNKAKKAHQKDKARHRT